MPNEPVLKNGCPTNLYMPENLKIAATHYARERYGYSLSQLVQRLLVADMRRKRGIARLYPRELTGA